MFNWFAGDSNERELKKLAPVVKRVNDLEPEFQKLTDDELRSKTSEFKQRLAKSVADKKTEIDSVKKELEEAQACMNTVEGFDQKTEISVQCKRLQDNTQELDKELRKEENEFLDDILPEAFAAVREAARRTIHQRHFDVQLMGGIVLHHGRIAEMRTGEGKTLVATLPLYLNALTGRGVQLVTVNDYLARRDPYWMGPVFHALGVSVASIYPMQSEAERLPSRLYDPDYDSGKDNDPWRHFKPVQRKEAYAADITYGTSAEFGFDYLRDNMAVDLSQTVQREQNFAVVDEVDNLLIDEARTPLIISGPGENPSDEYYKIAQVAKKLNGRKMDPSERRNAYGQNSEEINTGYDYEFEEKNQSVVLTQEGQEKLAKLLSDPLLFEDEALKNQIEEIQKKGESKIKQEPIEEPLERTHKKQRIQNALRAKEFFHKDHEYMVKEGKVLIVDEFTGRVLVGRRYSEGLHQAIEAKENVKVEAENRTYATITIQNYFRMYAKLAGMTGTAVTEAEEFSKIYKLEVVVVPTNKPQQREDHGDVIFKNEESKFKALVKEVEEVSKAGRPVLIGTVAIQNSEILDEMLNRRGVKHNVLNAKRHEQEAQIIADAGKPGAVTVATNMAGRGVDIILGGKPPEDGDEKAVVEWKTRHAQVVELGGLHVLGSERHEARRIDNQLRGRAGRQGDPGSSRFYVALDDELMRRFGGERIQSIMNWAGMDENTPIENKLI